MVDLVEAQSHKNRKTKCSKKGITITKDQLLGEGHNADLQEQIPFDDGIIEKCCVVALRAWNMIEKPEKKIYFIYKGNIGTHRSIH